MLEYEDLLKTEVHENKEALIEVNDISPLIVCRPVNQDMQPFTGDRMLLRSGAAERLVQAARNIYEETPGTLLLLGYAYRSSEVQKRYFNEVRAAIAAREPDLEEFELCRRVHRLVACPDVAGHPSGGAVDVTLYREGGDLEMGSGFVDLKSELLIPTFSALINSFARENRLLLRRGMLKAGFAPFDGEWWHFSYGDREWAAYYGRKTALYGPCRPA